MMVVGTATAVGVALANERRLTPVFAHATPTYTPQASRPGARALRLPNPRQFLASKLATASLGALLVIAVVASIPALSTFASSFAASTPASAEVGPPTTLRAGSAAGGNWERAVSAAVPSAGQMGAALMAGKAEERQKWEVLQALVMMAEQKAAQERAAARPVAAAAPGVPQSLGRASGVAAGTILRARITVYGCRGPGGGFCGGMSSGVRVFEGAVACSNNLAMGTKLKIHGDPTGRVYECLDRGALPATWVDVYFHNTTEGMRWQGLLGGTVTNIEIVN
jgi:hypothetical protein